MSRVTTLLVLFGWVALGWTSAVPGQSPRFTALEQFLLSTDQERALAGFVPGSVEYEYYACLWLQSRQQFQEVEQRLAAWRTRLGESPLWKRIRTRQALLAYRNDERLYGEQLRETLGLRFDHKARTQAAVAALPARLPDSALDRKRLDAAARKGRDDLAGFSDAALRRLAAAPWLSPIQRRELLKRLRWADAPNLVRLIHEDLKAPESGGFGSLPIHGRLTLRQLDALRGLSPTLQENSYFVAQYVSRLRRASTPDDDKTARRETLDRMWRFVRQLGPAHRSLAAHVLYHRLQVAREEGRYPRDIFQQYLELPRNSSWRSRREPTAEPLADLAADFSKFTGLPAVGDESELVQDYLEHLLVEAPDDSAFARLLNSKRVRRVFAETKLMSGKGDPAKWRAMLSESQLRELRDRVELAFPPDQPRDFPLDQPVVVDLLIKNAPRLAIQIYEINAESYYRENRTEFNAAVELDGLTPTWERVVEYSEPALLRTRRSFRFPEIDRRGVFVVDFVANGRASRVVVRRGGLRLLTQTTAQGVLATVIDHQGASVAGARLTLGEQAWEADADGQALIPFSTAPRRAPVVLTHNGLASLAWLEHPAAEYSLQADFHTPRESLLEGEQAGVLVRPRLLLRGEPVSLAILHDVQLTITSQNLDGVSSAKRTPDFELFEDRESWASFRTPSRLQSLTFVLSAKVSPPGRADDLDLSASATIQVNQIAKTEAIAFPHLTRTAAGYAIDVLGRNGEPLTGRRVDVQLKHRDYGKPVSAALKTGPRGRIVLGELTDVEILQAKVDHAATPQQKWKIGGDYATSQSHWRRAAGKPFALPHLSTASSVSREDYALFRVVGAAPVEDRFDALSVADGQLHVAGLPEGDYQLAIKAPAGRSRVITIQCVSGAAEAGFWIEGDTALRRQNEVLAQVTDFEQDDARVRFRVVGAGPFTRVHVFASRFSPAFGLDKLVRPGGAVATSLAAPRTRSAFLSGRVLGDELQYIFDRRRQRKFPGNMLPRPSMLLNPRAANDTRTRRLDAKPDTGLAQDPAAPPDDAMTKPVIPDAPEVSATDFASLDFLAEPAMVVSNLEPDADGWVELKRAALGGRTVVTVAVVHPEHALVRQFAVADEPSETVDLRLSKSLDRKRRFAQRRLLAGTGPGESLELEGDSQVRVFRGLRDVYEYFLTTGGAEQLGEYRDLFRWNEMTEAERSEFYSLRACHELHFFLYCKDRDFFERIVAPHLRNKLQPTFLDHWLLGEDLGPYLDPAAYARLNTAERVLLARRIPRVRNATLGMLEEQSERSDELVALEKALPAAILSGTFAKDAIVQPNTWSVRSRSQALSFEIAPNVALKQGQMGYGVAGVRLGVNPPKAAATEWMARGRFRYAEQTRDYYFRDFAGKAATPLFVQTQKTQEFAENNYDRRPLAKQGPELVPPHRFWREYVAHQDGAFLSPYFVEATTSFTEMMFALAVMDLPLDAVAASVPEPGANRDGKRAVAGPCISVGQSLQAIAEPPRQSLLLAQQFYRLDDAKQKRDGREIDKLVEDEFLTGVAYVGRIVISNATSEGRTARLVAQIPSGAIPLRGSKTTSFPLLQMKPYSVQTFEYCFYFPSAGEFTSYGATASDNKTLLGYVESRPTRAVEKATKIDRSTWAWVSQHGTKPQVLDFLKQRPLEGVALQDIAYRMQDRDMFRATLQQLRARLRFEPTLWSYAFLHADDRAMSEYLRTRQDFVDLCGDRLKSPLLTMDAVERGKFEHLEYRPLINARRHRLGKQRAILNSRFAEHYSDWLARLCMAESPDDDDRLQWTYYLLLQDRIDEAWAQFERVDANRVAARMQYDYCRAYFAFSFSHPEEARSIVRRYENYGVDRWRKAFDEIRRQLADIEGSPDSPQSPERPTNDSLANRDAALEMNVEGDTARAVYRNLAEIRVRYYPMDIEVLYSRAPFAPVTGNQFTLVQSTKVQDVELPKDATSIEWKLPAEFAGRHVLVEVIGGSRVVRALRLSSSDGRARHASGRSTAGARRRWQSAVQGLRESVRAAEDRRRSLLQGRLYGPARTVRLHLAEQQRPGASRAVRDTGDRRARRGRDPPRGAADSMRRVM